MATATPTDLIDEQWAVMAPLLPPKARTGSPRADDRTTLNGILGVLQTGARWADLPRRYGAPSTCHLRLKTWQVRGVWEHIWRVLLSKLDEEGRIDWRMAHLDGTFVSAKRGATRLGSLGGAREPRSWWSSMPRACRSVCWSPQHRKRRSGWPSRHWRRIECRGGVGVPKRGR